MKSNTKKAMTLGELLVLKLRRLQDGESQLLKALPKFAKGADDGNLKRSFERHAKQTEGHIKRLDQAFEALGARPPKIESAAIRGLVADVEWSIKHVKGEAARDSGLLAAAQCAVYVEIAGYESVVAWAKLIEQNDVADLLQETLDEEKEMSDELTELAISEIDERALGGEKGETEEDSEEEEEDEG